MNKFWFMFKYYYLKNIKSKGFLILNIITALTVALAFNIDIIINLFNKQPEMKTLYIYDQIEIYDVIENGVSDILNQLNYQLELTIEEDFGLLIDNTNNVVVDIDYSYEDYFTVTFHANEEVPVPVSSIVTDFLTNVKVSQLVSDYGISSEQLSKLTNPIVANINLIDVEDITSNNQIIDEAAKGIISIMTVIIYALVMIYTGIISSTIVGEKTSKTTMLTMSSVSASDHLWSRVLSVFALQLTQIFLVIGFIFLGVVTKMIISPQIIVEIQKILSFDLIGNGNSVKDIILFVLTSGLFWYYIGNTILFIVLNTLLILIITAVFASVVSSAEDAGYVQMPIMLIIIFAYLGAMILPMMDMIFLTKIFAYIPIVSVMFMPICIVTKIASVYDIIISLITLIASLILISKVCVPIYKRGILNYSSTKVSKQLKQVFLGKN